MDLIAFNWLVYQLTNSAVYLAINSFCRMAPILVFTLFAGVVADRMERRRLMFFTQTAAMLMALILALLVTFNLVQVWMVLVIAVGRGIMMSFNGPARQSLVSDLVPREDLMNAVALNFATINLTRVIGPAVGGLLIATVGVAGAFYFNAASFVAVLYGLALMRFPERSQKVNPKSMLADLVGGVRYLRSQPTLWMLVLLALLPVLFGNPYLTMMPVFAQDVLDVGSAGLGFLSAASGLGAVVGALVLASRTRGGRRGWILLLCLVAFGLSLGVFAFSRWFWLSLLAMIMVGGCQQAFDTMNNTLLQENVDEEYRGRALSTLFLNRGLAPLGAILVGVGTEAVGVQITMGAMAAIVVLIALVSLRFAPALRGLS